MAGHSRPKDGVASLAYVPAMTERVICINFDIVVPRVSIIHPCVLVAARRIPAGFRSNCRFEPFAPPSEGSGAPKFAAAESAAAVGQPCGVACPFSGRELPIHNADRRASRRPAAAFFLRPRDRLLGTDRGGRQTDNALDSAGFPPRSSVPTSPLPDGPT